MCLQFLVKYLLFFLNLIISLAGIAFIAVGVVVYNNLKPVLDLLPIDLSGIPIYVIVIGCVIFVITFPGCYGAITETGFWLILYGVFMLILAAASSYLAYLILGNLSTLPETVEGWVTWAFDNSVASGAFTIFETTFRCCGSSGADSYINLNLPIPRTCCAEPVNDLCPANSSYLGCSNQFYNYLDNFGEAVGIVIAIIVGVQVFVMLSAFYMNHQIKRKVRRETGDLRLI